MAATPVERLRVVVCGAVFGQVYLEAFRSAEAPLELAGILARGSPRAAECARFYGVPLFTRVDDVPSDVTAACVVVRAGVLGGKGTELAQALMRRGIHVLQEHPLHPNELGELLRLARAQRVQYRLNSFYVNVTPVRRFIAAARELCAAQRPVFIDAACGCQLSFSLLDIVGTALGQLRPWEIVEASARPAGPFVTLNGSCAGVPMTMRIHNELDPANPDGYSHLLHQVTFRFPEGSLSLVDTHGPVVWTPRPQFPHDVRTPYAPPHFAGAPEDAPRLTIIGPATAPSFDEMFRDYWPSGVRRALLEFGRAIANQEDPLRFGAHQLAVAEMWRDALARIGPPRLVHGEPVGPLSSEKLAALRRAGAGVELMP